VIPSFMTLMAISKLNRIAAEGFDVETSDLATLTELASSEAESAYILGRHHKTGRYAFNRSHDRRTDLKAWG